MSGRRKSLYPIQCQVIGLSNRFIRPSFLMILPPSIRNVLKDIVQNQFWWKLGITQHWSYEGWIHVPCYSPIPRADPPMEPQDICVQHSVQENDAS